MLKLVTAYIKERKWLYLAIALALIIYDASLLVPTQVIQGLIDSMVDKRITETSLWQGIGILMLANLISYATAYFWHLKLFQEAHAFNFNIQRRAFQKLVVMRAAFYEKFRSGDMMTRFSSDTEALTDFMGYGIMILLYAGGMFLFVIPTMFVISWQITLVAMLPMPLLVWGFYRLSNRQEEMIEDNREAVANLSNQVVESIEGVRVMRAYGKKKELAKRFRSKTEALTKKADRIMFYQAAYRPLYLSVLGLSTLLVLGGGAYQLQADQLSLGQLVALQLYVVSLAEPFSMLADFILVYQTGRTSFYKIDELIETGDDMEEDGDLLLTQIDTVSFKDYSFTYPQAKVASLENISFDIRSGQTLGIVGKTGSGKTTLLRQFLRQYPLGKGQFTINRQAVSAYQRKSLETLIAYVPQEHTLFSRSVGENIALGKSGASPEEINQSVETAAFAGDLENMTAGLATAIGEQGVSISGGQKQRISIARAFIKDAPLLILDDSLSAVDAKTEDRIIQNIQKERQGRTNIIVSHRLSAVNHADWILVLEEGRIVEAGKPDDLLAKRGWYYEQYQAQQTLEEEE